MMRFVTASALLGLLLAGAPSGLAQEEEGEKKYVTLPKIPAYQLSKGKYLLWKSKVDEEYAQFIRDFRKVPLVESRGTPTSLIIPKYLKREARAYDTDECYLESDWLSLDQLTTTGSLSHHIASEIAALFGGSRKRKTKEVFLKTEKDYLSLVDLWADNEKDKKEARYLSSTFVDYYRCGYDETLSAVYSITVADTAITRMPKSIRYHPGLKEALHVYMSALLVDDYSILVSLDVTSPENRSGSSVDHLFFLARTHFSKRKRPSLETLLSSELNSLSESTLAVLFSLVDFLMRNERGKWKKFGDILEEQSYENGKIKGPYARRQALIAAIGEGFGYGLATLEKRLSEFVQAQYLTQVQLANTLNMHGKCSPSTYNAFLKVCKERRAGNLSAGNGDIYYERVLELMKQELEKKRVPF